jgi:hypothetical protein
LVRDWFMLEYFRVRPAQPTSKALSDMIQVIENKGCRVLHRPLPFDHDNRNRSLWYRPDCVCGSQFENGFIVDATRFSTADVQRSGVNKYVTLSGLSHQLLAFNVSVVGLLEEHISNFSKKYTSNNTIRWFRTEVGDRTCSNLVEVEEEDVFILMADINERDTVLSDRIQRWVNTYAVHDAVHGIDTLFRLMSVIGLSFKDDEERLDRSAYVFASQITYLSVPEELFDENQATGQAFWSFCDNNLRRYSRTLRDGLLAIRDVDPDNLALLLDQIESSLKDIGQKQNPALLIDEESDPATE